MSKAGNANLAIASTLALVLLILSNFSFAQSQVTLTHHLNVPDEELFPGSVNIAHSGLGGRLQVSDELLEGSAVEHAIDGIAADAGRNLNNSFAWIGNGRKGNGSHDLVVSFHKGKAADLVGFTLENNSPWYSAAPQQIDVFISNNGIDGPWISLQKELPMRDELGSQSIKFDRPVTATHLWLRLSDTFYSKWKVVTALKAWEAPHSDDYTSIVNEVRPDILSPGFGAQLVRFPETEPENPIHAIMDGNLETSWTFAPDNSSEFTAGFQNSEIAVIKRIELQAMSKDGSTSGPAQVEVGVSTSDNPIASYDDLGTFELGWEDGIAAIEFADPVPARFIKFKPIGSATANIAELRVFEPVTDGYDPLFFPVRRPVNYEDEATSSQQRDSVFEPDPEPNNTAAQSVSLPVKSAISGELAPQSDIDFYKVDASGIEDAHLAITATGIEGAAARYQVTDTSGLITQLASGIPERFVQGEYTIAVNRPPESHLVLLFDVSGSMENQIDDVYEAANAFISKMESNEKIALMKFSNQVSEISDFSADRNELLRALEGSLVPDTNTALYGAVIAALGKLNTTSGDKGLVLISDGSNTIGETTLENAWQSVEETEARLFTIGLGNELDYYGEKIGLGGTPNDLLDMWARATGGQSFRSPDPSQLGEIYEKISDKLRTTTRYQITTKVVEPDPKLPPVNSGSASDAGATANLSGEQNETNQSNSDAELGTLELISVEGNIPSDNDPIVEIIFDGSGSMISNKNRISGELKSTIAKRLLIDLVKRLPETASVGLRTFGHRVREGQAGDCEDIELIYPHDRIDRSRLINAIEEIAPLGTTPIYNTLRKTLESLRQLPKGPKSVILITDGEEECLENPEDIVQLINEFSSTGIDLKLNVIGFALGDNSTKSLLARAAEAGNGQFFDAQDGQAMAKALKQSFGNVRFDVIDATDQKVASGIVDQSSLALPIAPYRLLVYHSGGPLEVKTVMVAPGVVTSVELKNRFGEIQASVGYKTTGTLIKTQAEIPLPGLVRAAMEKLENLGPETLTCEQLWLARNQIFNKNGYCFGGPRGQEIFDNSDCYTSEPVLTAAEKQTAAMLSQQEDAKQCQ